MSRPWRKSDSWRRAKLAWKRFVGREPRIKPDLDVPLQRLGDWWLCAELVHEGQKAYSFGVGEDIGFDLALIQARKVDVFAFDPTPNSIAWLKTQDLPARFHFFPWAVAEHDGSLFLYPRIRGDGSQSRMMYTIVAQPEARDDGVEVSSRRLPSIMANLGHDHVDILKMDIEGAEYGVLEDMLNSLLRPTQLLLEFHHRFPGLSVADTVRAIGKLRQAGYGLARISSSGREFTFILKARLDVPGTKHAC
jgi:FkbM family methyltransferase